MLDREPFLRAIFADPADDLPRLVFADWLDEHGDGDWAELIRIQCEYAQTEPHALDPGQDRRERLTAREAELIDGLGISLDRLPHRGFVVSDVIATTADMLADPDRFRAYATTHNPEWYGATTLEIAGGRITRAAQVQTILTSPVTERIRVLDLSGAEIAPPTREQELAFQAANPDIEGLPRLTSEYTLQPVIAVRMVEYLAMCREVRRLTVLDLRNNELDNDALRALAKSPCFIRLEHLYLSSGNRFRGRVWQQVLERFGPDVVESVSTRDAR